jgi:5-methyltetrahydrofolate--homocysteine methyltransferase
VSCYPNAGLPNPLAETGFDETPTTMAPHLGDWAREGFLNIVGGCCGTTPEPREGHRRGGGGRGPAALPIIEPTLRLSGLEPLTVRPDSNFQMIGERTNVTGSPEVRPAHPGSRYERGAGGGAPAGGERRQSHRHQHGRGMLDSVEAMRTFLNLVGSEPDIARIPIMIDSSNWAVLEAGLACLQGKGVVNSISLKDGEASSSGAPGSSAASARPS